MSSLSRKRLDKRVLSLTDNEQQQQVNHSFRLINRKDVKGLLDLFAYDAVVFEPFSDARDGQKGKSSIEYLLRVAVMAFA
ncbi:MAG TPA: hypothetical protein VFZ67_03985 [Nitrososphaera sp.]